MPQKIKKKKKKLPVEILSLKERRKRANAAYVGYALFAMAHTKTKTPQCKTIEQCKTRRVTDVPRATTARSRSNQFVW